MGRVVKIHYFKYVLTKERNDKNYLTRLFNSYQFFAEVNLKHWVPTGVPNWRIYLGTPENQIYQDYQ